MKNLWVPLSGAIAQQRNVETLANNVANANTPGFKKDQVIFKEYLTAHEKLQEPLDLPNKEWSPQDFYHSQGAENAFVKVDGTYINLSQGNLTPTGNPLDIGLKGPGLFEVMTPQGVRYTRRGVFSVSARGELVTDQGYYVLSKKEEGANVPEVSRRIVLPRDVRVNINLQGQVSAGNTPVGELSIVEFKDPHALRKEGNSLFVNAYPENARPNTVSSVYQGFIEESNVNAISEMSELIKAHRHFDAIQNAIKAYDQISGKSVNELGKF